MAQGQQTERLLNFDRTTYKVKCLNCGKQFLSKRNDATYCSPACRKQASRKAHAHEEAIHELLLMAYRVNNISKDFSGNQAVLDQVQLLAASIKKSLANFQIEWKPQELPLDTTHR